MKRFVKGVDRTQGVLLPETLDDYVAEDNPVRIIDVFVDTVDLAALGFDGTLPAQTGRPSYHPAVLLILPLYNLCPVIQGQDQGNRHHFLSSLNHLHHSSSQLRPE
jgi:transposase